MAAAITVCAVALSLDCKVVAGDALTVSTTAAPSASFAGFAAEAAAEWTVHLDTSVGPLFGSKAALSQSVAQRRPAGSTTHRVTRVPLKAFQDDEGLRLLKWWA